MTATTPDERGPVARVGHRVRSAAHHYGDIPAVYVRSLRLAKRYRADLQDVRTFCIFIGHARSGHSIVGAALDAHRNVVTAHEADALRWVRAGLNRSQVFSLLLDHERQYNAAGRPARFNYVIPDQWQGRFDKLTVIGDKHGPAAARRLNSRPELLERLRSLGTALRVVHVVRNPFDNISTRARMQNCDLDTARIAYFKRCEALERISGLLDHDELLVIRHEDFVGDTETVIRRLCAFVDVDSPREYVAACASIVLDRPHHSRDDAPWSDDLIRTVDSEMQRFPLLSGYRFSD